MKNFLFYCYLHFPRLHLRWIITVFIRYWIDQLSELIYGRILTTMMHGQQGGVVINEIDGAYFILTNAHVILESFCFEIDQIEEDCENRTYDEDIVIA